MAITLLMTGGLGNQMFQYAAARALSLRLGVPLVVDLRFYEKAVARSPKAPWILDFPLQARIRSYAGAFPGAHSLPRRALRRLYSERGSRRYVQPGLRFDPAFFDLRDGAVVTGEFQSPLYFQDAWHRIAPELDLISAGRLAPDGEAEGEPLCRMIGVHVRRGDYAGNPAFAMADAERYYGEALAAARARGDAPVLVFSDDIAWCRRQPLFAGARFRESAAGAPPYHDLFAMSLCRTLVIANSSFSWWAAWFAHLRGADVIAPARWIMGETSGAMRILPDAWLRL